MPRSPVSRRRRPLRRLPAGSRGFALDLTRRARWRPSRRGGVILALLLIIFFGLREAGNALVVSRDVVGAPDAIVVLASHEWERLPAAAKLAHAFPASLVLLTVPRAVSPWNCHLCSERVAWLQNAGIAAERIVELPDRVSNTRDEAIATRRFAGTRPIGAVVVVTSPYHTRRALHVFAEAMRGAGVAVGVVPASASSPADPAGWWWHPYDRWYVTYEWSALLYYGVRFGVPLT